MRSPQNTSSRPDERIRDVESQVSHMARSAKRRKHKSRPLLTVGTRLFNPLLGHLAGRRSAPLFAVVRHRGRRSGRLYATPVAARRVSDGFVIPLTFGQEADWFRNIQTAGSGVIRWRGVEYGVVEPEVVDRATARSAFPLVLRALIPVFGIAEFVHLRLAPSYPLASQAAS
jgi:deazaflavin-dependent oxidoreductase (nitroreductase family)